VRNVDFGEAGAKSFKATVRANTKGTLQIRTGSKSGSIKGKVDIEPTNGEWQEVSIDLTAELKGVQNLFFTFLGSGNSLFDFDCWQFSETTTGIKSPTYEANEAYEPYKAYGAHKSYDLSGRPTSWLRSKLNIINGKKILKK